MPDVAVGRRDHSTRQSERQTCRQTNPLGKLTGRSLESYEEFLQATELYSRVFGYTDPGLGLNTNLLTTLSRNGGSTVGVFDDTTLVGFAYGFSGQDLSNEPYHFSQAAVVDSAYQGLGVGKRLKLLQRDVALTHGHTTMRWTFEPLLARNAHFNLNSLGATAVDFVPNYFARPGSDRLVVQWSLTDNRGATSAPGLAPPHLGWGQSGSAPAVDGQWLAIPAHMPTEHATVEALRTQVRTELTRMFTSGLQLVSCMRVSEDTATYLAVPMEVAHDWR